MDLIELARTIQSLDRTVQKAINRVQELADTARAIDRLRRAAQRGAERGIGLRIGVDRGVAVRARNATDQRASASSLDRRALAVTRHDPAGDRDDSLADVGRFEHLKPRSDRQQAVRHLVGPADAKA